VPQPEPISAPAEPAEDFSWRDDPSVVCHHQLANPYGGIVIRQERDWNDEEDVCIVVSRENIAAFLDKVTEVAGVPSAGN
jgi:hypothetical protein